MSYTGIELSWLINNTGPIGPQSKKGEGLIESADIVSDTWGCEPGKVGGRVRFRDIEVECFCEVEGCEFFYGRLDEAPGLGKEASNQAYEDCRAIPGLIYIIKG